MVIKDCIITNSDATVLKRYVDSREDPLFKKYHGFYRGIDLEVKDKSVYSMFHGTVDMVSNTEDGYSIRVKYDNGHYLQYSKLKKCEFKKSEVPITVDSGQKLGSVSKYVTVFYITLNETLGPVRIGDRTLYKNDPTPLLKSGSSILIDYGKEIFNADHLLIIDKNGYTSPPASFMKEFEYSHGGNMMKNLNPTANVQYSSNDSTNTSSSNIVSIALKEVGNNHVKYCKWYGMYADWCGMFVSWCANQSGDLNKAVPKFSYVPDGGAWFKSRNQWKDRGYQPSPGDIIFFNRTNNPNFYSHVGLVEKCDGTKVYTVEGNTGVGGGYSERHVQKKSYSINDAGIKGYGVPKY